MRTIWILCVLTIALPAWSNSIESSDTTIHYKGKKFELSESSDPVEVKVYSTKGEKMEQIYEGKFENGEKKSSQWEVKEVFSLPFLDQKKESKKKKKPSSVSKYYYFEPCWSGVGFGLIYPTDCSLKVIRDYADEGILFNEALSFEVFLNAIDFGFPLYKDILGLTFGLGLNWRNMTLDGKKMFQQTNDYHLGIITRPEKVCYSTLMTIDVVVPLLLEWHIRRNHRYSGFSIAAGGQLNIKTYSNSRTKFYDEDTERKTLTQGIGSKPLSVDVVAMIGYKFLSIYAKHAITPMFTKGKGPLFYPTSLGAMISF